MPVKVGNAIVAYLRNNTTKGVIGIGPEDFLAGGHLAGAKSNLLSDDITKFFGIHPLNCGGVNFRIPPRKIFHDVHNAYSVKIASQSRMDGTYCRWDMSDPDSVVEIQALKGKFPSIAMPDRWRDLEFVDYATPGEPPRKFRILKNVAEIVEDVSRDYSKVYDGSTDLAALLDENRALKAGGGSNSDEVERLKKDLAAKEAELAIARGAGPTANVESISEAAGSGPSHAATSHRGGGNKPK